MRYSLLYHKDTTLLPEARVFLWQWLNIIGPEGATNETLRELCKRLTITVKKGSRALAQLKEYGAISATKQPQAQVTKASGTPKKRGRPRTWHCVSAATQQWLKPIDMRPDITQGLDKLISFAASSGDTLRDGEARKETLTLANSWLVAVLLAHMDHAGQVTTLGYADLMALTGMSRSRIQSQITKLNAMGVLHHQPGSMRVMLGARLECSTFTLNLHHAQIGYTSRSARRVVFPDISRHGKERQATHVVNGIVDAAGVFQTMEPEHQLRRITGWKRAGWAFATSNASLTSGKTLLAAWQKDSEVRDDVRHILSDIKLSQLHRWKYEPALAGWWLAYVQRYACWLLEHDAKALRTPGGERQTDLRGRLKQDFPDASPKNIEALDALAHALARSLLRWLTDAVLPWDTDGLCVEGMTLMPVMHGARQHWQLQYYLRDEAHDAVPTTTLVTLETVGSDFADWLKRRASG